MNLNEIIQSASEGGARLNSQVNIIIDGHIFEVRKAVKCERGCGNICLELFCDEDQMDAHIKSKASLALAEAARKIVGIN